MFETASFHIVKPCNFSCKYCYATFEDMHVGKQLPVNDAKMVIVKLQEAGLKKITFAGGEPLLYKGLLEVIEFCKRIGLVTSIITNGSFLDEKFLAQAQGHLDWIGISVDSLNIFSIKKIGRHDRRKAAIEYYELIENIQRYKYKLKINTVVNKFNVDEDMNNFIEHATPDRWKVFQALRVEGQNDQQFDEIKVTDEEFNGFVIRHAAQPSIVVENNEAMTGSYLLIDPLGRLFENSEGKHTYSDTLVTNEVDHCLSQITLNRDMFIQRGGIYNW